jgi:hypothetical protein
MNTKNILSGLLLLFVAVSLVVLGRKQLRSTPPTAESDGVVAYYFHGKARCPTCQRIESQAREAVEGGFAAELQQGKLQWRVVNYDEPGNEHFAKEYNLAAPIVVFSEIRGGTQVRWVDVPEVWQLVDDKPAFIAHVQGQLRAFLDSPAQ